MIITFNLVPRPTFLSRFLDRFFYPYYPPLISSGCHHSTSTLYLLPTFFPGTERCPLERFPHPSPSSLRISLCTPCLMPESAVASRVVHPPFAALVPHTGPCCPLGVCLLHVSPCLCVLPPSLCAALIPFIFRSLFSLGVLFVWGTGAQVPPLPVSRSSWPMSSRYMATPDPSGYPPPPPYTSPPVLVIPSMSEKSVGCSAGM